MSSVQAAAKPGAVSRALARDRLGVPSVLFFALSSIAPLTVAAGVITSAYATTGLTGIPAAFIVIAVVLALFAVGYMAMARHITHAGPQILSAAILTVIVVLAAMHYGTLPGVPPGSPAAWMLPAAYAVAAVIGLCWGAVLRGRRPWVHATIGLGANAVTGQAAPAMPGQTR
jgi:hypothetical protein